VLSLGGAVSETAPMDTPDVATVIGVQDLYARYAHRIDRRDFAGFAALFTDDASFFLGEDGCEGRAAIETFMQDRMKAPGGAHIITNVSVRAAGDDRYAVVADYLLTRRTEENGPWATVGVGIYESVATLDGDAWRFAEHRIIPR
jgi:uncharacterized protein (TIGR02246 family)